MSVVLTRPQQTSGFRPPIPPSVRTGFADHSDDDSNLPFYMEMRNESPLWERWVRQANQDDLRGLVRVFERRKKHLNDDLTMVRIFGTEPITPQFMDWLDREPITEDESVAIMVRLLNRLDELIATVKTGILELNGDSFPSE
ncbi:hypothetical protein BH11ARM1_BH11ARM1_04430 [soil metagenome]